jgi:transcriptional regulator with XRE-family HTH domain
MHGSLPTRLRVLRAERGLTLRDAEHQTGVDKDTLSKIERGLRHPHDVTLAKIARGYGVPVEELLEQPALPLDETLREAGPTAQDVTGGGIQSSDVGGGHIYREPTEQELAAIARELEDLQHDIAAGEGRLLVPDSFSVESNERAWRFVREDAKGTMIKVSCETA